MVVPNAGFGTLATGQPAPTPGVGLREPFALRFAWLIVVIAGALSIGLVVAQFGWDWPFSPTRKSTTTEALAPDGKVVQLTTSEADAGGAREALFRSVAGIA